jgi:hypothetical protein
MSMQRCCPSWKIPEYPGFEASATLFKALGDPYRLTILATLSSADEVCVRRGTWVYYQLAPDALERLNDAQALVFRQKVLA